MKNITREKLTIVWRKVLDEKFELIKKARGEKEAKEQILPFANAISTFLTEVDEITEKELQQLIK